MNDTQGAPSSLLAALQAECGECIDSSVVERGDLSVVVKPHNLIKVLSLGKSSPSLAFNLLADITAVDWMDQREERFEVVYQLLSISKLHRITIKVPVSEATPEVPSAVSLWSSANFMEREVWDMFGVRFTGHPDLRRILMYEEFVGHPLRKDYPLQGKQPRIPLRASEVENTARRMARPDLVTIRSKSRTKGAGETGAAQ